MKHFGLILPALMLATGAFAQVPEWKDRDVFSVNAETERTELIFNDSYQSLNGIWDFKYADTEAQLPQQWSQIKVPGNWEMQGYGIPVYVNTDFEFATWNPQPPFVPEENPVGIYRRTFDLPQDWAGRQIYLNLAGAKSGVYVQVNGNKVGYNEDSKDLVRFNITKYLTDGSNEVLIKI